MIQKFLAVAICGMPNAGKSTLVNRIVDKKLSITSRKEQTTRTTIRGVFRKDNTKILLFDTPGLLLKPKTMLEKAILLNAKANLQFNDKLLFVIDATKKLDDKITQIIIDVMKITKHLVFVINKVDLVDKKNLLELISLLKSITNTDDFFLISAKNGSGVDKLIQYLINNAQNTRQYHNQYLIKLNELSHEFLATEITREKLFLFLHQELPYNIIVTTEKWQKIKSNKIVIHQNIFTTDEKYKKMIVGKNAQTIKNISLKARQDIQKALEVKNLSLFIQVKVKKNMWNNNLFLNTINPIETD